MNKNYYEILEVTPQANAEQIKSAVVELGRKYAVKFQTSPAARSKFNEIQQAYRVLSHPQRRKYHDESLAELERKRKSLEQSKLTAKIFLDRVITQFKQFFERKPRAETQSDLTPQSQLETQSDLTPQSQLETSFILKTASEAPAETKTNSTRQPKSDKIFFLNKQEIAAKKYRYNLFEDETILFYSTPHILSCLDFTALILMMLSSYWYFTNPLQDYMLIVTLWLPSQFSEILPALSLWDLGTGSMFVMGMMIQLEVLIYQLSSELLLTSERIISKTGVLSHKKTEIRLNMLESVSIEQSLLGRLFGYGTVQVIGVGQGKIVLRNIRKPQKMSHFIWSYIKIQNCSFP